LLLQNPGDIFASQSKAVTYPVASPSGPLLGTEVIVQLPRKADAKVTFAHCRSHRIVIQMQTELAADLPEIAGAAMPA
jgi:hypothetical protein